MCRFMNELCILMRTGCRGLSFAFAGGRTAAFSNRHPTDLYGGGICYACRIIILAIFYPPLKQIWGCFGLILQTWKGNIDFTELAERVEYGNYDNVFHVPPRDVHNTLLNSKTV